MLAEESRLRKRNGLVGQKTTTFRKRWKRKIVSYADKLIDHSKRVPIELEIKRLQKENKVEAAERVRKLNEEITSLLGNKP